MAAETVVVPSDSGSYPFVVQAVQVAYSALESSLRRHTLLSLILMALLAFLIVLVIKNIILSPLRAIPGPWLAGLTSLYEFYYDVVKNGTYAHQHSKMHQKYGTSPHD